ncbi:hypothetical protein ACWDAZ_30275, partial [Streptomyces sp. NPDC001215]
MTGRPLIGVSTYLEARTRWGRWELDAALLPAGYPLLVQRPGTRHHPGREHGGWGGEGRGRHDAD